jgi:hypothetical protein
MTDTALQVFSFVTTPGLLEKVEDLAATHDEALELIQIVAGMKQRIREIDNRMQAAAIAWIEANGDLDAGNTRYYVGTEKVTKCNGNAGAIDSLFAAAHGDMDAVAGCLASDALKHGACRKLLGDTDFAKHFTTTERPDLKTGAPKKGLRNTMPEHLR